MPKCICKNCGNTYEWFWIEAFDKFGFNDGDGQVETYTVGAFLSDAGYDVVINQWGMHNTIIVSIKRDGIEVIPDHVEIGYDNPREYLLEEIISLLDNKCG